MFNSSNVVSEQTKHASSIVFNFMDVRAQWFISLHKKYHFFEIWSSLAIRKVSVCQTLEKCNSHHKIEQAWLRKFSENTVHIKDGFFKVHACFWIPNRHEILDSWGVHLLQKFVQMLSVLCLIALFLVKVRLLRSYGTTHCPNLLLTVAFMKWVPAQKLKRFLKLSKLTEVCREYQIKQRWNFFLVPTVRL